MWGGLRVPSPWRQVLLCVSRLRRDVWGPVKHWGSGEVQVSFLLQSWDVAQWARSVVSALWLHAANSWAQPPTAQACDCFLPGNRFLWTDRPPLFFSPLLPPFFTSQPRWTWRWKWTHITPACCLCPTFISAASLTSRMYLSRHRRPEGAVRQQVKLKVRPCLT